jgi:hypothetical protein
MRLRIARRLPRAIPTRHGWLHKLGWIFGFSPYS